MDDIKIVVARNIKKFREMRKVTQHELAEKLDVGDSVISNWEMGTNSPNVVKLFMICQILDVTPSVIMGVESEATAEQLPSRSDEKRQTASSIQLIRKEQPGE